MSSPCSIPRLNPSPAHLQTWFQATPVEALLLHLVLLALGSVALCAMGRLYLSHASMLQSSYYVMNDPAAFREGVGRLLSEVQRIKAEGDYPAAKQLFEKYGVHFDPKLRDEVVARVERLHLPSYTGFVMPKLEAVRGANADVISDVKISYPQDLAAQMLEYAAATRSLRQ